MEDDERTDEHKKLDAANAAAQDAADAFANIAEAVRHATLQFQLAADPLFMVRPTPVLFSHN